MEAMAEAEVGKMKLFIMLADRKEWRRRKENHDGNIWLGPDYVPDKSWRLDRRNPFGTVMFRSRALVHHRLLSIRKHWSNYG